MAHLSEAGEPTGTVFVNDTSQLDAGQARVWCGTWRLPRPWTCGSTGHRPSRGSPIPTRPQRTFRRARSPRTSFLAGTDTVAIGPADLNLAEGTSTIVYAWGSANDQNLALAVQPISGLHDAPGGVPAGDAGLVDEGIPASW